MNSKAENTVALVTGAGQGIGRAMALCLAEKGLVLYVNDIDKNRADKVVSEITESGGVAFPAYTDVSDAAQVTHMVTEIIAAYGKIGILINNARAEPPRPQGMALDAWWDRVFAVNLKGAYLCSLACFDHMETEGYGRIVNISSIQAFAGKAEEDWIAYSSAKSGMQGLTRSFAKKGMGLGITANIIAPDYIETEVMERRWGKEKMAQYAASVPIGRAGKPQDITKAMSFLIDADFITGETIFVNGGRFIL